MIVSIRQRRARRGAEFIRNFMNFSKCFQTKLDAQQFAFTMCRRFFQTSHYHWVVYALKWLSSLFPITTEPLTSTVPISSGQTFRWCATAKLDHDGTGTR
jgi:hypothetical protein